VVSSNTPVIEVDPFPELTLPTTKHSSVSKIPSLSSSKSVSSGTPSPSLSLIIAILACASEQLSEYLESASHIL